MDDHTFQFLRDSLSDIKASQSRIETDFKKRLDTHDEAIDKHENQLSRMGGFSAGVSLVVSLMVTFITAAYSMLKGE